VTFLANLLASMTMPLYWRSPLLLDISVQS